MKNIVKYLFNLLFGFITTKYFPSILALALNRTHGVGNNPDGEMFVPFGIILLICLVVANLLLIFYDVGIIFKNHPSRINKIISVAALVVGFVLGYISHSLATGRWEYLSSLVL